MSRRRGSPGRAALVVVMAALALPSGAPRAGSPDPQATSSPDNPPTDDLRDQAASRKKSGDEAMEALRFSDALAAYSDAYAITKDPALLYNMGRALQALNRFPEALDKLEAFEATAPPELKARVPRLPKLIADLRQRVSTLTVRTNVKGARILVRDTVVGRSPLPGPMRLTAGPAAIEIEAEGYFPGKKALELPGGSELTVELNLFSKITTGVLSVRASAAGAEVLVDGRRIGVAPLELNVKKGTHQIVVKHPDYRVYETSAVVPAGATKSVVATLQPPSVLTRWWFWGGVGVVAAAGVAVTIAAVTERGPDSGTIAPGQLQTSGAHGGAALFRF